MHDINKITVYAPSEPPELHDAIVAMMERKSGKKVYRGHSKANRWLFVDHSDTTVTGNMGKREELTEITLHDLENMPDYKEEVVEEMTVAEISKELGYTVKVVE